MMIVHNASNLPTIDYRLVRQLQGDLKDLDPKNEAKLLRLLKRRGFTVPLFLWQSGDDFYLLDGHQRQRVMTKFGLHDNGNYQVPYVLIHAKDEADAKSQLLEITSQYGTMTEIGFTNFAIDVDKTLLADVHFDAVNVEKLLNPKSVGDGEGGSPPTVKRTFTFTAEQAELVDRALKKVQQEVDFAGGGGEVQATALVFLARQFLGE